MSGKGRIGKRSIIGSVVAVHNKDGLWRRGTVTGVRTDDDRLMPFEKSYEVEIKDGKCWDKFYCEDDIYGPGFNTTLPSGTKLLSGQSVYVTHEGREVKGSVLTHHTQQDCISVKIEGEKTIFKSLEEIRLIESRKSARLGKSVLDFSKLAEMGHPYQKRQKEVPSRRRLHSMSSFIDAKQKLINSRKRQQSAIYNTSTTVSTTGSNGISSAHIDVPNNGTSLSRKRRTSESRLSDVESGYMSSAGSSASSFRGSGGMANGGFGGGSSSSSSLLMQSRDELRDCTAAMVLMNLSTSPSSDLWQWRTDESKGSPIGNASTATPHSSPVSGLYSDEEGPLRKCAKSAVGMMYKCTWRGCGQINVDQLKMERHVRGHLGRREPLPGDERDMEEEFYYTEIELDVDLLNQDIQDILHADVVIDTSENSDSNDTDYSDDKQVSVQNEAPAQQYIFHTAVTPPRTQPSPRAPAENILATSAPPSLSFIPENGVFTADLNNVVFHHPSISEHMDMVKQPPPPSTSPIVLLSPNGATTTITPPTTTSWNPKKLVSIVPKPELVSATTVAGATIVTKPFIFSPPVVGSAGLVQSVAAGGGVIRSDKKCRKLYGLEQKDLWCTQCKWKKACARFN